MDCYIYISFMTLQQSDTYLATWFDNFKNKNTQHNITGLLFYNGGNIIQLFEGPVIETQQLFQLPEFVAPFT